MTPITIDPSTDPSVGSVTDDDTLPAASFPDYALSQPALDALAERGLISPTPIQAAAIPALLGGRDVVGQARTGSGKTLAFGLPLLEAVDPSRAAVQALVLAPTRELASQVAAVLTDYGSSRGVTVALLYGGTSSGPQRTMLRRGAQVVVGTPGRILDLIGQGALWLDQARFVVLDEADEMFDQGFAPDVERIMDKTSNSRQTALFSATMPDWVRQTAARYLDDPASLAVDSGPVPTSTVPHVAYVVPDVGQRQPGRSFGRGRDDADLQAKFAALRDLLDHKGGGSAIVFGRTRQGVAALSKQLERTGYPVGALQGNMTQAERDHVMAAFRSDRIDILVATNVAARGLDLVGVNLVINVELPESAELLTHRIGRTGRMGRGGQAITLLAAGDLLRWDLLIRDLTVPIRREPWPGAVVALADGADPESVPATTSGTETAIPTPADDLPPAPEPVARDHDHLAESPRPASPPSTTDDHLPQTTDAGAAGHSPEAGATMDDDAMSDQFDRPTRRGSRRPADSDPAPGSRRPSANAGDPGDLIARALASVGAPTPNPTRRDDAPIDDRVRPDDRNRGDERVRGRDRDRDQDRAERRPQPTVEDARPMSAAAPVGRPNSSPAADGRTGTPRPAWLQDAALRASRLRTGFAVLAESAATSPAGAPAPMDSPPAAFADRPVSRAEPLPERIPAERSAVNRDRPVAARPAERPAAERQAPERPSADRTAAERTSERSARPAVRPEPQFAPVPTRPAGGAGRASESVVAAVSAAAAEPWTPTERARESIAEREPVLTTETAQPAARSGPPPVRRRSPRDGADRGIIVRSGAPVPEPAVEPVRQVAPPAVSGESAAVVPADRPAVIDTPEPTAAVIPADLAAAEAAQEPTGADSNADASADDTSVDVLARPARPAPSVRLSRRQLAEIAASATTEATSTPPVVEAEAPVGPEPSTDAAEPVGVAIVSVASDAPVATPVANASAEPEPARPARRRRATRAAPDPEPIVAQPETAEPIVADVAATETVDATAEAVKATPAKRTRRSRKAADPVAETETAPTTAAIENDVSALATESEPDAAVKPARRASRSRRAATDPETPADTGGATTGTAAEATGAVDADVATAPPASETPVTVAPDATVPGDDELPARPKRASRSRAQTTADAAPAESAPAPEPRSGGRGRGRSAAEAPDAPDGEPAPGNRKASGRDGRPGQGGRSADPGNRPGGQGGRPAGPERGNERGVEVLSSRPPAPPRPGGGGRRFATAPAATRCAACGTPTTGTRQKYCPACASELAARSRES